MRRRAALAVVPLLLLATGLTACGNDKADEDSSDSGTTSTGTTAEGSLDGVSVTGSVGSEPKITVKDLSVSKTKAVLLTKGTGTPLNVKNQSLVDLAIYSGVDGSTLFSSWSAGQKVPIGPTANQPIKGLNDALDGVPTGSRVAFEARAGDAVTADVLTQLKLKSDDALVVVADIFSVQDPDPLDAPKGQSEKAPAGTPDVVESAGKVTGFDWKGVGDKPKKVQVITLVKGDGPKIEKDHLVTFNYFGELFKGTKAFDESYSKAPTTFAVGSGGLIPAWDESLVGVTEGSRVLIITPPDKGYGAQGSPPAIPANSTLAFVIDVLGVG